MPPADRARNRSLFFDDLLYARVREFNPRYAEAEGALLGQFRHLHAAIYGNREFVEYLRNRGKFFDHEERRERDLILIDYDEPANNVYEVTEEWAFHNGHYGTREDIVFAEKDEELNKYILRQHQTSAVEATVTRALDPARTRGLVWHTQGSGKTFTMIKAAERLFRAPEADKPTILLMIDRNELEDQMLKNLAALGLGNLEHAGSISRLNKLLKEDYRGIIVTMIHKLRDMPPDINTRSNIYVLIDEAHRTTGGDLGNFLMAGLPNATFVGFTGTPVDKTVYGKGTFKTFGCEVNLKNFLKSRERIEKVAYFVAGHYLTNVEPLGYKAFLIGVDREACALYKQAIDQFLPPEYSEVVYTGNHNDSVLLKKFHLDPKKERQIRKNFCKLDKFPKILIVTEKLLTGFDSPLLYTIYLDKPMRDHTLLQAIARVNRPYENEEQDMVKPHGFVLNFVGIFDKLEKALAFDSEEINAIVKDIKLLKVLFKNKMESRAPEYLSLVERNFNDKDVDTLIEHFRDRERRKAFFREYKEIEMLYEIISPDSFLRPFIEEYATLSAIYDVVRKAYTKRIQVDRDFQRKTNKLVQDQIGSYGIGEVERVRDWAAKLDVQVAWLGVRPMQNKWASCSTEGHLNFNAELLDMDEKVWDYVIVHELLHFSVLNHGKLWKSLMRLHLGEYEACSTFYRSMLGTSF